MIQKKRGKIMRNDMEIKGRLKWYLRWPIILNIIVGVMTLGVTVIDHKAGALMGVLRKTSGVFCLKSNVFRQKRLILF